MQYKMAEGGAGIAGTTGSFTLANMKVYDDDGDLSVESSVLGVELLFIDFNKLLVVVDIISNWALVISSCSLVSVSWSLVSSS